MTINKVSFLQFYIKCQSKMQSFLITARENKEIEDLYVRVDLTAINFKLQKCHQCWYMSELLAKLFTSHLSVSVFLNKYTYI